MPFRRGGWWFPDVVSEEVLSEPYDTERGAYKAELAAMCDHLAIAIRGETHIPMHDLMRHLEQLKKIRKVVSSV